MGVPGRRADGRRRPRRPRRRRPSTAPPAPAPAHGAEAPRTHGPAAALGPMRIAALTIAALLTSAPMAAAQGSMRLDRSLPSNEAPAILKNVDVEQHLERAAAGRPRVPRRDRAGPCRLRDLLHEGRPVILAPAYYECPMLCTQVLNSLFTALGVVSLNPGKDFEVVVVSFDPKEPSGLAPRQEGRLHGAVQAAGHRGGVPLPDRRRRRRSRRCSTPSASRTRTTRPSISTRTPAMIAC